MVIKNLTNGSELKKFAKPTPHLLHEKQRTTITMTSTTLASYDHVKRGPDGNRPSLVSEVKNANNLFNSGGDYLGNGSRSTVRLENGEIVAREGLICPDCKDRYLSCDELLQHHLEQHVTEKTTGVGAFFKTHRWKLIYTAAFGVSGLAGVGVVLAGRGMKTMWDKYKAKKED